MVFSYPCSSIVCMNVSPNPSCLPQNLTAIQYCAQIRKHVMHKVQKCKLNLDIVGQSIETIESELNKMQMKLEHQFQTTQQSMGSLPAQSSLEKGSLTLSQKHSPAATKDKKLYMKLQELIEIYRQRVQELKDENENMGEEGSQDVLKEKLKEEIMTIRDELYNIQNELGIQTEIFNL